MTAGGNTLGRMGRQDLEDLAHELHRNLVTVQAALMRTRADHDAMHSTQELCTRQLQELRVWRRQELEPLATALAIARSKHPKGSNLASLVEEVGEVASAMRREGPVRVREELLDVATVAMRLYLGETVPGYEP